VPSQGVCNIADHVLKFTHHALTYEIELRGRGVLIGLPPLIPTPVLVGKRALLSRAPADHSAQA
jgi:hypothetical protein